MKSHPMSSPLNHCCPNQLKTGRQHLQSKGKIRCLSAERRAGWWRRSVSLDLMLSKFSLLEVSKSRRIVGMWLIAAVQSIDPLGSRSVSSGHSAIGIALHVELAIILMCGLKAESFVEPQSRVEFHDGQAHSLIETCGLAD